MAAPSDLTAEVLCIEAYIKMGTASPSTAQKTRAGSYFLREVLNDIWQTRDEQGDPVKFKTLRMQEVKLSVIGISKYSFASDFDDEISITFLNGDHADTATAGAAKTITLAADEDVAEADCEGNYILTTGGTGTTQLRQVTDYNTTTLVVTINTAWTTNPDNTTTYRIINRTTDLEEDHSLGMGGLGASFSKGDPTEYCRIAESGSDYFLLDKPPDASTYGFLIRYYADPNKLDLSGTQMTKIYNDWQNILTVGVARKIAEDEDDDKFLAFDKEYGIAKAQLLAKEIPFGGEFQGFII